MSKIGWETKTKIAFHQIDGKRDMTASSLLAELQEIAIVHSDSLGYTIDFLTEKQRCWAVINWHLQMKRLPRLGEEITVQTWCDGLRKMQATRSFHILGEGGEVLLKGASRWVFMDVERRRPANALEGMLEKYRSELPPAIADEKFIMPREDENDSFTTRNLIITRRDTDMNGHANNVKYMEWAMDEVPDAIYDVKNLEDIRIVYRKECKRGEEIVLKTTVQDLENSKQVITFLTDLEGTVLAEVVTLWGEKE